MVRPAIADWNHHTVAKRVVDALALLMAFDQAGSQLLLQREATHTQVIAQAVPTLKRNPI